MPEVKIYNTLSRKVEIIKPLHAGRVGIYACGPTVYDYQHLGNYRTYLMVDLLRRVLEINKYTVKLVVNITDVGHLTSDADEGEDKMEKGAQREQKSAQAVAAFYTADFVKNLKLFNIELPSEMPKATEYIPEMIALIQKLEEKGYTYKIADGIYFDTGQDEDYGRLAKLNLAGQQAGARAEPNPQKKNPADFALWKFSNINEKRQMEWDSPWGRGFPGWHIECSAMSQKLLGVPFDIHAGGIDHIPVHHTNEIAQTKAAYDCKLARYFVHFEHLLYEGKKMAKSAGTFIQPHDLLAKKYSLRAFRYLCLIAHYREKLNFTWESLDAATQALGRVDALVTAAKGTTDQKSLDQALELASDDLATPRLLAFLHEQKNPWLWQKMDSVLGLGLGEQTTQAEIPSAIQELIKQREILRQAGKFDQADELRAQIINQGYQLDDTKQGSVLKTS